MLNLGGLLRFYHDRNLFELSVDYEVALIFFLPLVFWCVSHATLLVIVHVLLEREKNKVSRLFSSSLFMCFLGAKEGCLVKVT